MSHVSYTTFDRNWVLVFKTFILIAGSIVSQAMHDSLQAGLGDQQEQDSVAGQSANPINKDELQTFFDRLIPQQMQQRHIPGAVVAVVKDAETVLAQGYGYARLDGQVPVDADKSLFRIASVTKLFTWTAVMQLVEAGKLDLETDINQYLSAFQVPGGYTEPITLANLMSHSAGFEDRGLIGTLSRSGHGMITLEQYLARNMPSRVRPPGHVSAYSNYGGALAGYIVTEVSGLTYDQYLRQKIFAPLGMKQATALQSAAVENMAVSYIYQDGIYRGVPYAYLIPVPEGGISASATSMARFMIAHLEDGRMGAGTILRPDTARQMHGQSFTHHPQLPGWAHGFEEKKINGQRVLEHGGYLSNFSSLLVLVPSERLGLFVSFNSGGGSGAGRELRKQFFDRFLPATSTASIPAKRHTAANLGRHAGFYAPCRRAQTTMAKLGSLVQASRLKVEGDHTISFLGRSWLPQQADLFRAVDGEDLLATRKDQPGQIDYLFLGPFAWERMPWYQSPIFQLPLVGICLVMFLTCAIAWPIGFFLKRRQAKMTSSASPIAGVAHWTAWLCSIINLVFVTALATILSGDTSALEFGLPLSLRLLLALPIVSAVLSLGMLVFSIVSWKTRTGSRFGRVHYAGITVASLAFVWFLTFWNLLGWHFPV